MFQVALVAFLLQIAAHNITCLKVLAKNTSDNLASTSYKNSLLPDSKDSSIIRRQHEVDISQAIRSKHYTS
jgi:hypothetical protein